MNLNNNCSYSVIAYALFSAHRANESNFDFMVWASELFGFEVNKTFGELTCGEIKNFGGNRTDGTINAGILLEVF